MVISRKMLNNADAIFTQSVELITFIFLILNYLGINARF